VEADFGAERLEQNDGQDVCGKQFGTREDLDAARCEARCLGLALGKGVALLDQRFELRDRNLALLDHEVLVEARRKRVHTEEELADLHASRLVGEWKTCNDLRECVKARHDFREWVQFLHVTNKEEHAKMTQGKKGACDNTYRCGKGRRGFVWRHQGGVVNSGGEA